MSQSEPLEIPRCQTRLKHLHECEPFARLVFVYFLSEVPKLGELGFRRLCDG